MLVRGGDLGEGLGRALAGPRVRSDQELVEGFRLQVLHNKCLLLWVVDVMFATYGVICGLKNIEHVRELALTLLLTQHREHFQINKKKIIISSRRGIFRSWQERQNIH